jgi:hypothetical protein
MGEALLYALPECLDTGNLNLLYVTSSNLIANTCYSAATTSPPINKFQSYYGYQLSGTIPPGYMCDFKVFFEPGCKGPEIGNGGNGNICINSVKSPAKLSLKTGAVSYMWMCYRY